jgi:hypothetical protein
MRRARELDRRLDLMAWSFLEPLSGQQRDKLVMAMAKIEWLLRSSMVEWAIRASRVIRIPHRRSHHGRSGTGAGT